MLLAENVRIYGMMENGRCLADVEDAQQGIRITGLCVIPNPTGGVSVHRKAEERGDAWPYDTVTWADVKKLVKEVYLADPSVQKEAGAAPSPESRQTLMEIDIEESGGVQLYYAGLTLPESGERIENIRILDDGESAEVLLPKDMPVWNSTFGSWKKVRKAILRKYQEYMKNQEAEEAAADEIQAYAAADDIQTAERKADEEEKETLPAKKREVKKNALGRIEVAENNAFMFVPQTMMRLEASSKISVRKLETVLSNPDTSGIGPFEIEILDWVSRLTYSTKAMILDLVLSGFISLGRREKISADKLSKILGRLQKYDLINLLHFVAVDDNGDVINTNSHSAMRVNTLGWNGYSLLKELCKRPGRSNFVNVAEGDMVKRYLTSNQWLIYWLTHYPSEEILDYSTAEIISYRGRDWTGSRVYAVVNMKQKTLTAEPARRCEEYEKEKVLKQRRDKFLRLTQMYDHTDQLYGWDREKKDYTGRPVITYLCEDEKHVEEVAGSLSDLIAAHPQQEVWFAADIWTYNYDRAGRRFVRLTGDGLALVDLAAEIGVEEMTMEDRRSLILGN